MYLILSFMDVLFIYNCGAVLNLKLNIPDYDIYYNSTISHTIISSKEYFCHTPRASGRAVRQRTSQETTKNSCLLVVRLRAYTSAVNFRPCFFTTVTLTAWSTIIQLNVLSNYIRYFYSFSFDNVTGNGRTVPSG